MSCIKKILAKNDKLKDFEVSQCKMTSKIVDEITKLFVNFESSQEDSPGREVPPPLKKAQSISSPDGILCESPSPIKG